MIDIHSIINEDEDKLFNDFLRTSNISHAFDRELFVKWALISNANRSGFWPRAIALEKAGFNEMEIKEMLRAYEWIENVLDVLCPNLFV